MKFKYIIYSMIISCFIYMSLFIFVVHKPLTEGIKQGYFQKKISYLMSINSKKIIVLAGSNGRFSHRCETIEVETGIPCVNMSIEAGFSLYYQFEKIKPYLKTGDLVYLPLEYNKFAESRIDALTGSEIPFIVAYEHDYLLKLNMEKQIYSMFYFDLKYLISCLGEMILNKIGVKRRFTLDTMTVNGDESTHNREKAKSYKAYIDNIKWTAPPVETFDEKSFGALILTDFMKWATANDVTIVGGLPTTFNDSPIPDKLTNNLYQFYKKNGHYFLVMQNKSQYPRDYFFDTKYHLAEEYQIIHSKMIANFLFEFFK